MGAAFDRFCTPVPLARRKAAPDKFERLALDLPFGRLIGWAAGPAQGEPVLFVHGWNAQGDFFQPIMSAVARQGLRAIAFDMPAHGQTREANPTKPSSTLVEWAETLIAATHALDVRAWRAVIGHSFGTLAAGFAMGGRPWAATPPMPAGAFALIAGAAGMPSVIDSYARTDPAMAADMPDIVAGVEAATHTQLSDLTLAAIDLPDRLMVAHDPADAIAPWPALAEALGPRVPMNAMLRPGAEHDAILFSREVIRAVAVFAAEPASG